MNLVDPGELLNKELLQKHVTLWLQKTKAGSVEQASDKSERQARKEYYRSWTKDRLKSMTETEFSEFLSKLWAMLIWGNKHYYIDKVIHDNRFETVKEQLIDLIWGQRPMPARWDEFRKNIKGIGPAMMSEILCHVHSNECMLWNRRAFVGLRYLGVSNLPRYNYQLNGAKYLELSSVAQQIAKELEAQGFSDPDLLTVDYFIWDELQVEDSLAGLHKTTQTTKGEAEQNIEDPVAAEFIHNEVRDKLSDIGEWYGFQSRTEVKVADGSVVDTIWEATIGNMGRVIYVFEVQTKGSIDSLILNLLKSLNNPAVQGVVAVSDSVQLEKIRKHAASVKGLNEKLKYWDYTKVLQVHEALELVNEAINGLGLVPQGLA